MLNCIISDCGNIATLYRRGRGAGLKGEVMQKFIIALALVVGVLGVSGVRAEVLEEKKVKEWSSAIIKEDQYAITRIATVSADKSAYFAVDFFPGFCDAGRMKLLVPNEKTKKDTNRAKIPGSLRVDTNDIIDISFLGYAEEKLLIFEIEGATGERIFSDALKGQILRFQMRPATGDKIYSRFSLQGFTAAYERARTLCDILRAGIMKDGEEEKYFKPAPPTNSSHPKSEGVSNL